MSFAANQLQNSQHLCDKQILEQTNESTYVQMSREIGENT